MASITGMLANAIAVPYYGTRPKTPSPGGMAVECSSRPQKKATSHHMKTRPKKTQPWDVRRKGPTVYSPLPVLPPDWTLVSEEKGEAAAQQAEEPPATGAA
ncbi:ribosomal protein 6 [Musa troglodytarum]|nr:ribosomal protein 6 [Musa troglodytarum]